MWTFDPKKSYANGPHDVSLMWDCLSYWSCTLWPWSWQLLPWQPLMYSQFPEREPLNRVEHLTMGCPLQAEQSAHLVRHMVRPLLQALELLWSFLRPMWGPNCTSLAPERLQQKKFNRILRVNTKVFAVCVVNTYWAVSSEHRTKHHHTMSDSSLRIVLDALPMAKYCNTRLHGVKFVDHIVLCRCLGYANNSR